MIDSVVINKISVKHGAGLPSTKYAQLVYKDEEVGFINEDGIFIKMYNPGTTFGVFQNMHIYENKTFAQKCKLVELHWKSIYDSYNTVVRGK